MTSLIVALLLAQTPPTQAQALGAVRALYAAQADLANRSVTYPAANSACIGPAAGNTLVGRTTIRVGVVLLSKDVQAALGATPLKDEFDVVRPWVYGAFEIQFFPDNSGALLPSLPPWVMILNTAEVEVRGSPYNAACEIFMIRDGFTPSPWRCSCSTGVNCNWTPPIAGGGVGASVAAPKNLTLPPGLWSGAGCVPKPCVEWAGINSMPLVCR